MKSLSAEHLAHLATSGLTPEICREAGLYTETDARALAEAVGHKYAHVPALMFPFFEPGQTKSNFVRARPDQMRADPEREGKFIKYEQPRKVPTRPYFPPRTVAEGRLADTSKTLYITEGEKKALTLDQLGYAVIGLVGVNNFHDVEYRKKTGEYRFHELVRTHVKLTGRPVCIVFDGDATKAGAPNPTKANILKGADGIAHCALEMSASAVFLVLPPENGPKGIDDFFVEHGEQRTRDLLKVRTNRFNVASPWSGVTRPVIPVLTEEHITNDRAAKALAFATDIYQRAGSLVRVIRDGHGRDGIARIQGAPRIAALPKALLRDRLTKVADWEKVGDKGNEPTHPPDWSVLAVLERGEWPGVPRMEGIVEIPVLRANGTVLSEPGYDRATGLLYEPVGLDVKVSEHPSREDAMRARDELLDIVSDFPFASDADRSAWLAAVLTPFTRYSGVDTAPLFLIDANTRGSGKSLLADVIGTIATGRDLARTVWISSDDEMRKQITACALAGDTIVLIDNVVGSLGSASFDAALTSSAWKARILGRSENTPDLPMRITWFATGNNTVLVADTARRTLRIRLESPEENPEDRDGFKHGNLLAYVAEHRSRFVSAALTILRAYTSSPPSARPSLGGWGSFDAWSHLIRGAVVWAGCPDPKATQVEVREQGDEEARSLRSLVEGVAALDPFNRGVTARELLDAIRQDTCGEHEALRDAVEALVYMKPGADLPNAKALGRALLRMKKRIVAGKYIDSVVYQGTMRWRVRGAGTDASVGFEGLGGFPDAPTRTRENKETNTFTREAGFQTHLTPSNPRELF